MTSDSPTPPITVLHREIPALAGVNNYQHPQMQFIYIEEGVLAVISEQGRHFVPPKQGIVIPAKCQHELIAKTPVKLTVLYFSETVLSPETQENQQHIKVISTSPLLSALIGESKLIAPNYHWDATEGRLLRLIRDKILTAPVLDTFLPYPKDPRLTNITNKLLKHPSLKSDLVSWGKFVKTSSRTLTRLFKKETDITYSEWRQRLNIQIAIKHLALGDSINSIAALLGYESSSAFIYMFKKQMHCSPNQFLS